ncbi:MAG: hypothetical protein WAW06_05755 [bacterium]
MLVELPVPGGSYYGLATVVLDDTGGIYAVRDSAALDREDKSVGRNYTLSTEACNGGTYTGEGLDWGGRVTLTRLDPLLSAGSGRIHSEDLLHRSASSRNHPNPFTSTTTVQFSLPRASSIGLAMYEDTALLADLLKHPPELPDNIA